MSELPQAKIKRFQDAIRRTWNCNAEHVADVERYAPPHSSNGKRLNYNVNMRPSHY